MPDEANWVEGGCHCGAVRFRARIRHREAIVCNCSICEKKGYIHVIVPRAEFELLRGADRLTSYRFHTKTANHLFCSICGIHSFYEPRSHPDGISLNLRCLDTELSAEFEIETFDGRHWEDSASRWSTSDHRT